MKGSESQKTPAVRPAEWLKTPKSQSFGLPWWSMRTLPHLMSRWQISFE
jgi:hypothetical protein